MIDLLISVAIAILVTVVPVMFAARIVRARRTGFVPAFISVLLLVGLAVAAEAFIPIPWVAALASVVVAAALLAGVLGTTLIRGFFVSLLAFIISVGVIVVLSMTVSGLSLAFYSL